MLLESALPEAALARNILIVDAEEELTRRYAEALAAEGWHVVTARNLAEAREHLRTSAPDMVVLDAHLPGESGFELAAYIRRLPHAAELPLLFMSGVYKAAKHRHAVIEQFGATDFLEKPVAAGELAARIRIALGPEPFVRRGGSTPYGRSSVTVGAAVAPPAPPTLAALPQGSADQRHELAIKPFHELLAELAKERASGFVAVRREKIRKVVTIRDGWAVGVRSNLLSDCLGRVLVRAGTINDEQCEESLERMRATNRPQGQVLVDLGYLTPRMLDDALELQLEFKLFDLFAWETGEAHFVPRVGDEPQQTVIEMSPARIIFEGLSRTSNESRLRRLLRRPNAGRLSVRWGDGAAEALATLANAAQMRPFVMALDGSRSIDEVLEARMVPVVRGLALVLAFLQLGLAELVTPIRSSRRASLLDDYDAVEPTDPDARSRLQERLKQLEELTHYEVLGVPRWATDPEIREAFRIAVRVLDPDASNPKASLRAIADQIYERYALAHAVLTDAAERARYDEEVPESAGDRAERILRADEAFRAGRTEFDRGRFPTAVQRFREAVTLYPEESSFHAWSAIAAWQASPDRATATVALSMLDHARQLHPRLAEAALFASHVRRGLGDDVAAAEELARAHALSMPVVR